MRAGRRLIGAVGDAVVHGGEVGQVEHVAHHLSARSGQIAFDMIMFGKRKMHRNWLRARSHFKRSAVIFQQQAELFEVISIVEIGPCECGFVDAGAVYETVRKTRIGARHGARMHADERITGADVAVEVDACYKFLQRVAQVRNRDVINVSDLREGCGRVIETRRSDENRSGTGGAGLGILCRFCHPVLSPE